jgi:two-component system OmpR family sensor kinase
MRSLPIRLRLTLGFAVAMAVVLAVIGVFLYHRVGATLVAGVDAGLRGQATESLPRLGQDSDLVDPDARAGSTVAEIVGPGGVVRSTPPGLAPILDRGSLQRVLSGHELLTSMRIQGLRHHWRVLAVPVRGSSQALVVARSLESREETLHRLLRELLIVGPLGLLLASLAGYALAAAALRPVEAMRRRAGAISAQTPGQRLPVPPASDEISRLAETLNTMLDRLEGAFAHERRFLADASHELRTPLSLLRTELELALRRPRTREELEQALRSAAEDTERLSRLANDLLLLAGADQDGLPVRRAPVGVEELLETARTRFGLWAGELGRPIEVEPTAAAVWADRNRLEQALANLIENALRHGAGTVRLSARERGAFVELHVEDAGPGFPPEFIERAFDRFSRADEARSGGGSGLGLSIVDLIARVHGGSAGASSRIEGGADVWISLPAVPAPGGAPRPAHDPIALAHPPSLVE